MPPPWFRWSWGDLGSRSHLGAAHPDRPVLLVAQSFPLPDLGKPDFYQNSWGPQMGPERGPPALELPLRRIPFEGLFWKLDSPSGLKLNFLLAKSWPLNNLTKQMNSGTCLLLLKGPTCLLNNLS